MLVAAPAGVADVEAATPAYVTDRFVRITTSPTNIWGVTITTESDQTIDPAPSELVLDIAERAKAAGIILSHQTI